MGLMFKKGDVLTASVDFDNALYFAVAVEIWKDGKFIDCGGSITKVTEDEIFIGYDDGEHYPRYTYEFRVR
jgi:hypothetical protein